MANAEVTPAGDGGYNSRPPRLPRWTRQEILVLIHGKRVVESRGRGERAAAEPKWAAVASYCRRYGVNRGPVQCRKRWSNLAGDYKKIKEWEGGRAGRVEAESFWAMRNDLRRDRKLPGFFDREVYDILDGASPAAAVDWRRAEEDGDGEEVVFDSGRTAAEDGLFSDFEEEKEAEEEDESVPPVDMERLPPPVVAVPISEKKMESFQKEGSTPGPSKDEQQGAAENSCKDSPDREGRKRRRTSQDTDEVSTILLSQLIEMLDRNNRMLTAQLEAQNINSQLDREQRKDQADGLLGVLNKLADALGRIADKL